MSDLSEITFETIQGAVKIMCERDGFEIEGPCTYDPETCQVKDANGQTIAYMSPQCRADLEADFRALEAKP